MSLKQIVSRERQKQCECMRKTHRERETETVRMHEKDTARERPRQ